MAGKIQNIAREDVFACLGSGADGLDAEEVAARIRELGPNSLEVEKKLWWLKSLGRQFTNFFTILLNISAGICFVAHFIQPGESMNVLGWALLGVSVLNALFSFVQEYRAERAMEETGQQLEAIVHSHPLSEAFPSRTDLKQAHWPESDELIHPGIPWLIISLEDPDKPSMRVFLMKGDNHPDDIEEGKVVGLE